MPSLLREEEKKKEKKSFSIHPSAKFLSPRAAWRLVSASGQSSGGELWKRGLNGLKANLQLGRLAGLQGCETNVAATS